MRLLRNRPLRTSALTLILGAVVAAAITGSVRASADPAKSAQSSDSATSLLQQPLIQHFAANRGVSGLNVLVSAGSGTSESAVISGTDGAGSPCWTVVAAGGGAGAPFRCGSAPGQEPGESADQAVIRAGCETSGSAGSATADAASCIGFVGSNVASIQVQLTDGSTQELTPTDGAFAYAASSPDPLPEAFVASDSSGNVLGRSDIVLASGLGNG